MKKKLLKFILFIFISFIFINVFLNSKATTNSIAFSINLFIKNIFPSLFPMFILSSILISLKVPEFLSNCFAKICNKLFNIKGIAAFVFFMSMLTGFPSNAKYIKDLINKKLITESEAEHILLFTFSANPLFIINTIGIMFLNNIKYGFFILISQILGNIIVGILFRNLYITNNNPNNIYINNKINNTNIVKDFLKSINNTLITLLNIFGIITCFIILINFITIDINPIVNSIFKGMIEMTTGLKYLSLTTISIELKVYIATLLICFGGISIHMQIFNILDDIKIKYYPFLLSRILHSAISIFIVYLIINLLDK